MQRYDTRIDDGTLYIEVGEEDMEIGSMDDVCEILGGETYTLEYDERPRPRAGCRPGRRDDHVRRPRDHRRRGLQQAFVEKMAEEPARPGDSRRLPPVRTAAFADLMAEIWDSKGSYESWTDGQGRGRCRRQSARHAAVLRCRYGNPFW